MKTVLATKDRVLVSLTRDALVALANCANEILHNSDIDERDCGTRLGFGYAELKDLHRSLCATIDHPHASSTEVFEAWEDGASIQLRAISVFGDPADLGADEVKAKILPLLDSRENA